MKPIIGMLSSDDSELQSTQKLLKDEGFNVFTYSSATEENVNSIYKNNPDIILLDIDIENSDGVELCYQLKLENALNSFIVIFTKHTEEYIQIAAFKAGVDDYIIKPIDSQILVKRIKALLKRKLLNPKKLSPKILSFKNLKIDRERYLVFNEGKTICLPKKEFEMLYLLLSFPQKVFSREKIYQEVWKKKCKNTRVIDVHIRKIREQIGEKTINTVKGVGYQLA
ncbi:MAG: DNA-binding response regulator [Flavobacteriales bacterium]|nr:MAG: DNA-binding response regulator [Flavobacteriales bacterium]